MGSLNLQFDWLKLITFSTEMCWINHLRAFVQRYLCRDRCCAQIYVVFSENISSHGFPSTSGLEIINTRELWRQ